MGAIIFWGIIRTALLIIALWILYGKIEYKYWWWFAVLSVYGVVVYPAMVQYRMFLHENEEIINNSLCSSCKHFDKTAVICLKYDKHPTLKLLPCKGMDWEPKGISNEE